MSIKQQFTLKDFTMVVAFLVSTCVTVGTAVAYTHSKFAYRDEVSELRAMVYDLLKDRNLHQKYNNPHKKK